MFPDLCSSTQSGESLIFKVGMTECCYEFKPIDNKVFWSISPEGGVTLDLNPHELSVDTVTDHGRVYELNASVEGGQKLIISQVFVVFEVSNPLIGFWKEESQHTCETLSEITKR